MSRLDKNRQSSQITEEERALIDEAVAAGRVTRVPMGASAFSRSYVWVKESGGGMQLRSVGASPDRRPGHTWRRQIDAEIHGRKRRAGS